MTGGAWFSKLIPRNPYQDSLVKILILLFVIFIDRLTQFRKSNQFTSLLASFSDELDGFDDALLQVKPAWLGLNTGSLVLTNSGNHFGVCCLALMRILLMLTGGW